MLFYKFIRYCRNLKLENQVMYISFRILVLFIVKCYVCIIITVSVLRLWLYSVTFMKSK